MEKSVAIIGAGKIGRGYLADLFGDAGYHLIFINRSADTVDKLSAAGQYTLFTSGSEGTSKKIVTGFEAYSSERDFDTVIQKLSETDMICVALYPNSYPSVADQLVATVRRCMKIGRTAPLNVLFFVNKVFTARTFHALIQERLTTTAEREYFAENVALVEALTHRGGTNPTPEMLSEDPLCISSGEGRVMPVGDNFKGPRPDMPYMQFMDRIEGRLVKKVWCGNLRHCTTAVAGKAKGYTYMDDCNDDAYVCGIAQSAYEEANFGVGEEFGFTPEEMLEGVHGRSGNAPRTQGQSQFRDNVFRVAADPLRKLAKDDRYIGPALLCLKHGRLPYFIARGAAYLLMFENEKDPSAVELQRLIREKGVEQTLREVSSLDSNAPDEALLFQLIMGHYKEIQFKV